MHLIGGLVATGTDLVATYPSDFYALCHVGK